MMVSTRVLCFLIFHVFPLVSATSRYTITIDVRTCTFTFDPPNGSPELSQALLERYPVLLHHDSRVLAAIRDRCSEERSSQCIDRCASTISAFAPRSAGLPEETVLDDTPSTNGSNIFLNPDLGIFKPELRSKKLLHRRISDYALGLKEAIIINFDAGLHPIKEFRKPRARLYGQKAAATNALRQIGACERHRRAKKGCNPACALSSKPSEHAVYAESSGIYSPRDESRVNSSSASNPDSDSGRGAQFDPTVFSADVTASTCTIDEMYVRHLRSSAKSTSTSSMETRPWPLAEASTSVNDSWFTDFVNEDVYVLEKSSDQNSRPRSPSATIVVPTRIHDQLSSSYPSFRVQENVQRVLSTSVPQSSHDQIVRGQIWSQDFFPENLFQAEEGNAGVLRGRPVLPRYDDASRTFSLRVDRSLLRAPVVQMAQDASMMRKSLMDMLRRILDLQFPLHDLAQALFFVHLGLRLLASMDSSDEATEPAWIECLGDLARYRQAIEDEDIRDRENWTNVSRFWYAHAADYQEPGVGWLYQDLAVLARPILRRQMFLYARSLFALHPYNTLRGRFDHGFRALNFRGVVDIYQREVEVHILL